jgi:hypothetical protein
VSCVVAYLVAYLVPQVATHKVAVLIGIPVPIPHSHSHSPFPIPHSPFPIPHPQLSSMSTYVASEETLAHSDSASSMSDTTSQTSEIAPTSSLPYPVIPLELLFQIIAISLGSYLGLAMLEPDRFIGFNLIERFIMVSRDFRHCTIDVLRYLWHDTFYNNAEG